jgi:hypothetical protein
MEHENARIPFDLFFPVELIGKGWELGVRFEDQGPLFKCEELLVVIVVQDVLVAVPTMFTSEARVMRYRSPSEISKFNVSFVLEDRRKKASSQRYRQGVLTVNGHQEWPPILPQ